MSLSPTSSTHTAAVQPDPAAWDAFVLAHPRAHALQLSAWGRLKAAYGWQAETVALLDYAGDIAAGALVLLTALPARLGTMAYIPMGPLVREETWYAPLWDAVQQRVARQYRAAFLKIEPGIYTGTPAPDWSQWRFRPSPQTVQPPRTILVDISADAETVLARMNQGTRRKVRTGEKKGVRVYQAAQADLPKFNALMQETGERKNFGVHAPDYYAMMFDLFVPDHGALFLAEDEGDTLAGILVLAAGKTAWYLVGASSNEKRNLMAPYALHWAAIEWAKARGVETYDLWGIPDEEEAVLEAQFQERTEGLWGVYGSKRGWGGMVARSVGAWDQVYNPVIYAAYRAALALRR
jgi:peptidoglycan pentaglycine glycine transferase (the first glycine)